jgi:hypothetical protein
MTMGEFWMIWLIPILKTIPDVLLNALFVFMFIACLSPFLTLLFSPEIEDFGKEDESRKEDE